VASLYVRDKFKTEVLAWIATKPTAYPLVDIYDPQNFSPPKAVNAVMPTFLALQYSPALENQASIGAPSKNLYRESGVAFLHFCCDISVTPSTILALAEEVRAIFRGKQFDRIRCYDVDPPVLGDGAAILSFGNWYGCVIAIDYEFDVQGA